jgi:hypothetical protein
MGFFTAAQPFGFFRSDCFGQLALAVGFSSSCNATSDGTSDRSSWPSGRAIECPSPGHGCYGRQCVDEMSDAGCKHALGFGLLPFDRLIL